MIAEPPTLPQRLFVRFAPSVSMLLLVAALCFRLSWETNDSEFKRLLILFPIVAVAAVFLVRLRNERMMIFSIKFGVVVLVGVGILLFA